VVTVAKVIWRQWLTPLILATQEAEMKDHGSKPAWANSLKDAILKNPSKIKGEGAEFKPNTAK
jgi:hypothetical protein